MAITLPQVLKNLSRSKNLLKVDYYITIKLKYYYTHKVPNIIQGHSYTLSLVTFTAHGQIFYIGLWKNSQCRSFSFTFYTSISSWQPTLSSISNYFIFTYRLYDKKSAQFIGMEFSNFWNERVPLYNRDLKKSSYICSNLTSLL